MRSVRPLVAPLLLLAPAGAFAGTIVLTPPILGKGATAKQAEDVYTLMSAELEFMEGVDEVVELEPAPPSLTASCLDSTRCLASVAKTAGGTHLVAGDLERVGTDLVLDMVYFDVATGSTLRRATWTVAPEPAAMVEKIPTLLRELVTGKTIQQKVAEERMTDVDFSSAEEEDFAFEEAKPVAPPPPPPAPKPAPAPATRAPGSTSTRVTNTTIVAPPPPPAPAPAPVEEEFDPSAFSFAGEAEDIEFGTTAADVGSEPPPPPPPARRPAYEELEEEPAPVRRPAPVPVEEDEEVYAPRRPTYEEPAPRRPTYEDEEPAPRRPTYEDEEPAPRRPTYDEDEDVYVERAAPSRSSTPARTSSTSSRSSSKEDPFDYKRVYIPVRGGYAAYGDYNAQDLSQDILFHFGTVGLELQVRAAAGFTVVLGGTGWIVTRETPPQLVDRGAPPVSTSFLPLINAGFLYRFKVKRAQPYLGLDGVLLPLAIAPTEAGEVGRTALAGGFRGRLGLDLFVAKNIAINGDVALGYMAGADWPVVDPRLPTSSFLPQISGGVVLAF